MGKVGLNPEWRCNAVPPSMRLTFGQRISRNLENYARRSAIAETINPGDSYLERLQKTLANTVKLESLDNKKGLELLCAKIHNGCIASINPFAAGEYMRNFPYYC